MKTQTPPNHCNLKSKLSATLGTLAVLAGLAAQGQTIQWGLTLTNINNPITPIVVTNAPGNTNGPGGTAAPVGSISITAASRFPTVSRCGTDSYPKWACSAHNENFVTFNAAASKARVWSTKRRSDHG